MKCNELDYKLSREDVLKYIINTIQEKKWEVNEKIYSENQLARILGVNRSMVREAYIALEGVGIIETIRGDGTYLRQFEEIDQESPLSLLMMLFNEDVKRLMEFRKVIEIGMIEPCINNISEHQASLLKRELANMKNNRGYEYTSDSDIRIHTIICEAVGNPFLSFVYNMILGYLNYTSKNNWRNVFASGDLRIQDELYKQHEKLVTNIINKDVIAATQSVTHHLNYINNNFSQLYD